MIDTYIDGCDWFTRQLQKVFGFSKSTFVLAFFIIVLTVAPSFLFGVAGWALTDWTFWYTTLFSMVTIPVTCILVLSASTLLTRKDNP